MLLLFLLVLHKEQEKKNIFIISLNFHCEFDLQGKCSLLITAVCYLSQGLTTNELYVLRAELLL